MRKVLPRHIFFFYKLGFFSVRITEVLVLSTPIKWRILAALDIDIDLDLALDFCGFRN